MGGCGSKKEPMTKNNTQFSSADIEMFKKTFEAYDTNNDRKMTKAEFKKMIKQSGEKKTDNEIECLFYSLPSDDQGRIEFDGFMSLLDGRWDDKEFSDNLARNLFKEFDKDKSTLIGLPEFKAMVAKLENITGKTKSTSIELNAKFREVDQNDSGKLSVEEVIKAINKN